MASFLGEHLHTLDPKGRVIIPASLRAAGGKRPLDTFIAVRGFERCVALFSPEEFKNVEERIRRRGSFDRRARLFSRMYLRHAERLVCDAQGRITLSQDLIRWAELKKDVRVFGLGDRIELWNPAKLDTQTESSTESLEQMGSEVFKDERS